MRLAYSYDEGELIDWIYARKDEFLEVDVGTMGSSFREGIEGYCKSVQDYVKGESTRTPVWPPVEGEPEEQPVVVPIENLEATISNAAATAVAEEIGSDRLSDPSSEEIEAKKAEPKKKVTRKKASTKADLAKEVECLKDEIKELQRGMLYLINLNRTAFEGTFDSLSDVPYTS